MRYYTSHLTEVTLSIEAGIRVYTGQISGHSGNTGNAIPTPRPLQYFTSDLSRQLGHPAQ